MGGPGITTADLLMAERLAQLMARSDSMARDPGATETARNAAARLEKEMLIQLGLSPLSRKGMAPIPEVDSLEHVRASEVLRDDD